MLASWPCQAFRRPRPILEEHTNYSQHPVQSIYRAPAILSIYSLTTAQPPPKNNQNNVVTTKKTHNIPPNQQKKAENRPLPQKPPKKPKNHTLPPTNPPSHPPHPAPRPGTCTLLTAPSLPTPCQTHSHQKTGVPNRGSGSPFWSPNFQISQGIKRVKKLTRVKI